MKLKFILAAATMAASTVFAAQPIVPVAPKTADGQTLVIPKAHRSLGTPYYALTNKDRQVFFESNAPLEKIKGQSNKVIGYAVVSAGSSGMIAAGEWHLPVKSLKTGIKLRDHHLTTKDWLDAEGSPEIIFQIRKVTDVKQVKKTAAFASYTATLVGDLTLHGVTRSISIPKSTITMMNESDATRKVAPGDLLAIRSKFKVKLSDYGVSHPVIGEKVANEVSLDVSLYMSTVPPKKS
jgi:polyisoprenoid-binding protein YceI